MAKPRHNLKPEIAVADAARIILRIQLNQVRNNLNLAAKLAAQDTEYVHQLRVSTRRAVAALEAFREYFPIKRFNRTIEQLNEIRRCASRARDLDVMILAQDDSLSAKQLRRLHRERDQAQHPILEMYHWQKLHRTIRKNEKKILRTLKEIDAVHQPSFATWANLKLGVYAARFFSQHPVDMAELKQLHQFRIEAKKLRYALEVLAPALPRKSIKKIRSTFKRLQDELGHINDLTVAIDRSKKSTQGGETKASCKRHSADLDQALLEFAEWWTPERSGKFKKRFDSLIHSSQT